LRNSKLQRICLRSQEQVDGKKGMLYGYGVVLWIYNIFDVRLFEKISNLFI
jgi:hypothetical protein